MASPANSTVQNLLPVQAYFNVDGSFNTFIGQGVPFYATANPIQSGLTITNSTINSTTIGASVPSTGVFSSGQVNATPVGSTDIANKQYVDSVAAGLSWKQPVAVATLVNITLSGLQTIDGYTTLAGDRVLVKNQSTAANNGIYVASSGTWAYATDANTWNQYVGAIIFIEYGTQKNGAWYCSAQPGGTLGVTAINWSGFAVSAVYTAGTGLTLTGYSFSITNTGVSANTYGSASAVPVIAVNAQGQITSATTTTIAIANTQVSGLGTMSTQNANAVAITGGTINGTTIGGTTASAVTGTTITANTQFTGAGTGLTGTASSLSIGGTAAKATNIAGGAAGSVPYQSGANTTIFLAAATNGQVLTLAAGVPSWATPTTGTVTSVSGTGTVNGITLTGTVTSSGSITLGGTLGSIANSQLTNSSITFGATAAALGTTVSGFNAVTIGATTASTGAFTYLSTSSTTSTTPTLSFNASNAPFAAGASISGSYLQHMLQNKSATAGASVNYVLSNDSGTDSTYYGEFGMNSSIFSASTPTDFFSINNGIYFSGHDGDVSIGSGNGYKTYFAWGTLGQSAHVINATGAIGLNTNLDTTPALSGTTNFGTSGQVLTSAGSAATPTWTTITPGLTIVDDTTTNATRYLTFTSATSGTITTANTSSTKLTYNPSTGALGLVTATLTGQLNLTNASDYNLYASGAGNNYMAGKLGIGGLPASTSNLLIAGSATGSAAQYGVINQVVAASDVTGTLAGFTTSLSTTAASFTLGDFRHFNAGFNSIGAGSTVTSQYGVYSSAGLTGATNNYGFHGNLAAATGRYNLYMAGTANNYLAGQLLVGTTAASVGYTSLSPTQSTNQYQVSMGGTSTFAGNPSALFINATITGTAATTSANGILLTATFPVPASGTISALSGINSQPSFNTTSTVTTYNSIVSACTFGAAAIGNTLTNSYAYNANAFSINAATTTAITTAAQFNAANIVGTAGAAITTAVAFYGRQAASNTGVTNNYNLYMSGTAYNYLAGNTGIGALPLAYNGLNIGTALTGSINPAGVVVASTVLSDATSSPKGYQTYLSTQATAFTISSLIHYFAQQGTIGATSAVTSQIAFYSSDFTGATNNYGFRGLLTAATGKFNLYMDGTAANYFGGDMQFNKTVTAAGTTGAQTISKNAGTVNFAAAATSLVVTNTLVTANSIIICTVGTNDTTMKSASAVAAAGSFTIYSNAAATAETRVNFIVIN